MASKKQKQNFRESFFFVHHHQKDSGKERAGQIKYYWANGILLMISKKMSFFCFYLLSVFVMESLTRELSPFDGPLIDYRPNLLVALKRERGIERTKQKQFTDTLLED